MTSLTKRQKNLASWTNPFYDGYGTKDEVKSAKLLARGHFWNDPDFEQYVSLSPSGRRRYFDYNLASPVPEKVEVYWKKMAFKAAKAWAQGNSRKSRLLVKEVWKKWESVDWPNKTNTRDWVAAE